MSVIAQRGYRVAEYAFILGEELWEQRSTCVTMTFPVYSILAA